LYDQHWRDFDEAPAEKGAVSKSKLFWKVDERQGRLTNTRLDTMLYHYVSMRTMNDVKLDHVFEEFKQWWLAGRKDVDQELVRLKQAAAVFRAMVYPDRTTRLGRFAHNLRVLDSTTVTPVVLFLAERLGCDSDAFLSCLTVIESYLASVADHQTEFWAAEVSEENAPRLNLPRASRSQGWAKIGLTMRWQKAWLSSPTRCCVRQDENAA
jgi:hypothetical protein